VAAGAATSPLGRSFPPCRPPSAPQVGAGAVPALTPLLSAGEAATPCTHAHAARTHTLHAHAARIRCRPTCRGLWAGGQRPSRLLSPRPPRPPPRPPRGNGFHFNTTPPTHTHTHAPPTPRPPARPAGSDKARTYALACLMLLCEGEQRHVDCVLRAGALPALLRLASGQGGAGGLGGAAAGSLWDVPPAAWGAAAASPGAASPSSSAVQEFSAAVSAPPAPRHTAWVPCISLACAVRVRTGASLP
jgi:hypothetical protein